MGACTLEPPKNIKPLVAKPASKSSPTAKTVHSEKSEKVKQSRLVVEVREKGLSGGHQTIPSRVLPPPIGFV